MEELKQKLECLEARAGRLERARDHDIDTETDAKEKSDKRAELTALYNRITELQKKENILLEQSRGNFLFLRVEFYFLLEFAYFLWP